MNMDSAAFMEPPYVQLKVVTSSTEPTPGRTPARHTLRGCFGNLDLPWFCLTEFRERNAENAVFVNGANLFRVRGTRKSKGTHECSVVPFHTMEMFILNLP